MTFPQWMSQARCGGTDLGLFFGAEYERQPEKGNREAAAKAVCQQCPVREECAAYALEHNCKWGVYGGMNEDERDRLWRKLRRRELRAVS